MGPIGGPAPRWTGQQTIGRNITWNWTCVIALQISDPSSRQQTRNSLQVTKERRGRIGRGSQMGAWHQDRLADWLSVVIQLWLWLWMFIDNVLFLAWILRINCSYWMAFAFWLLHALLEGSAVAICKVVSDHNLFRNDRFIVMGNRTAVQPIANTD
jgi:hypothetical protein